jgi:hypothetical protein
MIFSYGFLETEVTDAKELLLSLDIPDDDPLKLAKKTFSKDAPGVRLFTVGALGLTSWESSLVWWSCVNEEDGLSFRVLQTVDGHKELSATWKGKDIDRSDSLKDILLADPLWNIFQLRAVVILQNRFEAQLSVLQETAEPFMNCSHSDSGVETGIHSDVYHIITSLRRLEIDLLTRGIHDLMQMVCRDLEALKQPFPLFLFFSQDICLDVDRKSTLLQQRDNLMAAESVVSYFAQQEENTETAENEDDFS